ncbi:L-type lectin-like domain-containing protein C4F6.05c [Wickerhamiella sorbophila]|uniref:L-type lectin-like domain-containing protein C4F6.05c n=1 Tax=Wickerhamiella sorbophila TaxID=45607 RepID=A0A2T0FJG6_9ASCO|nr:L-type lectin-like domain-containing protein C4F6.05c [Wickerhamiella sorbophila]PRT55142.1 L-type lectin-like domain-containing protein C4F6.05c [Wickerhamiella sorbophila]
MHLVTFAFVAGAMAASSSMVLNAKTPIEGSAWRFAGDYITGKDVILLGTAPEHHALVGATQPVDFDEWTIEAQVYTFSGDPSADAAMSGLTLWYTAQPLTEGPVHGAADFWDGLAVMLDSIGWDETGKEKLDKGAIRGHLNDGSHQLLSDLPAKNAFSLCRVPYRQTRGGPHSVKIGYGRGLFIVEINDQKCFQSDQVVLPRGYVGVSADTSTSKDTFAIGSLEVRQGLDEELTKHFPAGTIAKAAAPADAAKVDASVPVARAEPAQRGAGAAQGGVTSEEIKALNEAISKLGKRFDTIETSVVALTSLGASAGVDLETTEKLLGASVNQVGERLTEKITTLFEQADRSERLIRQLQSSIEALRDNRFVGDIEAIRSDIASISAKQTQLAAVPLGPSLYQIVGISAGIQLFIYVFFAVIRRRRNLHQKLL